MFVFRLESFRSAVQNPNLFVILTEP